MPKILIEITEQEFNFLKKQVSLGWAQPIEQIIVEKGTILEDCNPENCISRDKVEDLIYDALIKCHIEPNHAYYVTKKILKEYNNRFIPKKMINGGKSSIEGKIDADVLRKNENENVNN